MSPTWKYRYAEWPPWTMLTQTDNVTTMDGVMDDILEALEHSLKYKFDKDFQKDFQFGSLQADGSYSGMIGVLHRNEVDIGGPFSASEQRARAVDFTNCLEFSKLGIITGITSTDRNIFLYFKVFSWQVWLALFVTVIFGALASVFIYDVTVHGLKRNQGLLLSRYLWIFFSHLFGHDSGTTEHWALKPIWLKHSFRILLAAWLLGPVINFMFSFQGTITSTFAITKLKPVISDLEELKQKRNIIPVTTYGSAVQLCFKSSIEHADLWQRMEKHAIVLSPKTLDETLIKIERGTHVLFADYIYALIIASKWVKKTGRCQVQVEELLFCQNFIALGIRKGFDKKNMRDINLRLTYIMQAKLADRWLNRVYANYTHCSKLPSEGTRPLSITDIMGGFVLWAIGIAAAIVLFFVELTTHKLHQQRRLEPIEDLS